MNSNQRIIIIKLSKKCSNNKFYGTCKMKAQNIFLSISSLHFGYKLNISLHIGMNHCCNTKYLMCKHWPRTAGLSSCTRAATGECFVRKNEVLTYLSITSCLVVAKLEESQQKWNIYICILNIYSCVSYVINIPAHTHTHIQEPEWTLLLIAT